MSEPLRVLIAGAGIAGLTLSIALARRGIVSTVMERRSDRQEAGAGIQLGPNATHALSLLGLGETLSQRSATPEFLKVFEAAGRLLTSPPLAAALKGRFGAPYWTLLRADLAGALYDAAATSPLITFVCPGDVTAALSTETAVSVPLSDGRIISGNCLVGADGVWSTLRRQVAAAATPEFTGAWAYRAVIDRAAIPAGIDPSNVSLWMTAAHHVVSYPVAQGRQFNIVVVADRNQTAEGWDHAATTADLVAISRSLPPPLRPLISATADWRCYPLTRMTVPGSLSNGRIVLIGDAAHPVLPYLAQGAGLAIEDAVELADAIVRSGPGPDSLKDFSRARIDRVTRLARASESNGRIYHLGGPARLARDAVLRLASPSSLLRRYDWLYGYRVRWQS